MLWSQVCTTTPGLFGAGRQSQVHSCQVSTLPTVHYPQPSHLIVLLMRTTSVISRVPWKVITRVSWGMESGNSIRLFGKNLTEHLPAESIIVLLNVIFYVTGFLKWDRKLLECKLFPKQSRALSSILERVTDLIMITKWLSPWLELKTSLLFYLFHLCLLLFLKIIVFGGEAHRPKWLGDKVREDFFSCLIRSALIEWDPG